MAFENAYITSAEYEQFQLAQVDAEFGPMSRCSSQWTIDRVRNIHMRQVTRTVPSDMGPHEPFWLFFWKSDYVRFACKHLRHATQENDWNARLALVRLDIPTQLHAARSEILHDIEAALQVYGSGGVHSIAKRFHLEFDVRA